MNAPDQDRLFELFQAALRVAPQDVDAHLTETCANESERAVVEDLLRADAENSAAAPQLAVPTDVDLERVLASVRAAEGPQDALDGEAVGGRRLGAYELVSELGRGGMGVVYLARQENTKQLVALKCLRSGISTEKMVQRFGQEVAVLGQLDHPGIARIFDAGAFQVDGNELHYFAMEYVRGSNLSRFVQEGQLDTRQRLMLIASICDAVHHAHRHGIVHRDLKPANILVTKDGQPKVMDFGVSRVVNRDRQLTTMGTEDGQLIGTLSYMSPEQAAGEQRIVDELSDVYALGVIAFEVLSGSLPHDLDELSLLSAARVICDQLPKRLSMVNSSLPTDVQTIVGKALEREPHRRYPSAAEMAADLRRFLEHETIQARPPNTLYSIAKFCRRHRSLVAGSVATLLILISATAFSANEAFKAEESLRLGERATYRATLNLCEVNLRTNQLRIVQNWLAEISGHEQDWEYRYLSQRADQSERLVRGHEFVVWSVAISADGSTAYSCGGGSRISRWDVATGEQQATVEHRDSARRGDEVFALALSPDGGTLAVGARDLRLRDAQTLETLQTIEWGGGTIHGLAFSPDGSLLATGDTQGNVRVWSVADALNGSGAAVVLGQTGVKIWELVFSPNGDVVACSCDDGVVRLWRVSTGEELPPIENDATRSAIGLAFAPDGTRLAIGYRLGSLHIVDLETREVLRVPQASAAEAHTDVICEVLFTPDGKHLLSASYDGTVRAWQADTLEPVANLVGHTNRVTSLCISPSGDILLSGAWDLTIRVWDAPRLLRGNLRYPLSGVGSIAVGAADNLLCTAAASGAVHLRSISSGAIQREVLAPGWGTPIGGLQSTSYPGAALASNMLLHVAGQEPGAGIRFADGRVLEIEGETPETIGGSCLAGRQLWAFQPGSTLKLYDSQTGALLRNLQGIEDRVHAVAVDSEQRWIAASDYNLNVIRIWKPSSDEPAVTLTGHSSYVVSLTFSPSGRWMISGSNDELALVWDTNDWQAAPRELRHGGWDVRAAFHPYEKRVATVAWDNYVRIWDVETWEQVLGVALPEGFGHPRQLLFSASGEQLLVRSEDELYLLEAR